MQSEASQSAAPGHVFVVRHTSTGQVAFGVLVMVVGVLLAVSTAWGLGWMAAALVLELLGLFGSIGLVLVAGAAQALVLDTHGVSLMGVVSMRSHIPWWRVQQLQVVPWKGQAALVCNADVRPQPGPARRVDHFPLGEAEAASVMSAATWLSQHADLGWRGRPGAAMPGASLSLVEAMRRRWLVAAILAALGLVGGCIAWFTGRTAGTQLGRLVVEMVAWALAGLMVVMAVSAPWAMTVCVEVGPQGIRGLTGRRLRVPSGISMSWLEVVELSVGEALLTIPRRDGRTHRSVVVQGTWRRGGRERIFALRIPPDQAQALADVVHAYRPDLI